MNQSILVNEKEILKLNSFTRKEKLLRLSSKASFLFAITLIALNLIRQIA